MDAVRDEGGVGDYPGRRLSRQLDGEEAWWPWKHIDSIHVRGGEGAAVLDNRAKTAVSDERRLITSGKVDGDQTSDSGAKRGEPMRAADREGTHQRAADRHLVCDFHATQIDRHEPLVGPFRGRGSLGAASAAALVPRRSQKRQAPLLQSMLLRMSRAYEYRVDTFVGWIKSARVDRVANVAPEGKDGLGIARRGVHLHELGGIADSLAGRHAVARAAIGQASEITLIASYDGLPEGLCRKVDAHQECVVDSWSRIHHHVTRASRAGR